jgi:hypothetical protein
MIDVDGYAPAYISEQSADVKIEGKRMKDISFGIGNIAAHYIACIGTGKGGVGCSFRFYITGLYDKKGKSIDGREMSIWTFLDYVKSIGATPLYFIGVNKKKGWW